MADNTTLNTGTGGDVVRTVNKTVNTTAKTQMVILDIGGGADASAETALTAGQGVTTAAITVTPPSDQTSAKGVQPTLAVYRGVQQPKDAGRNQSNLFMAAAVVSTATETLQSLTGYKSGAAVTATTTPAVVTTGKTYRIKNITLSFVAIATAGYVLVRLRANTAGVVAVTSPLVATWLIGSVSATAGAFTQLSIPIPGGLEFAAGTGIGITVQGFGATGTAAANGYAQVCIDGYEY